MSKGNVVTFIQTPDGNLDILYVNGSKVADSELITGSQLIGYLQNHTPVAKMENKELTWEACNRMEYQFPLQLEEFKDGDFK